MEISSGNQKTYYICRKDIYNDLIKLYSEQAEIVLQYPLQMKFMDEIAIDAGGVLRDSFQPFLLKPTIIFLMVHLSCIQPHMLVSICNHFLYWGQSFHMHTLLLGFSQTI